MNENSPVCTILNPGYHGINNNYQMLCLFLYVSSILVHTHYTPSLIAVLKTPVGQSWNVTLPFSPQCNVVRDSILWFYMFWCGGNLEHAVKNDWYCRGREYIQQYVYYTTKLPTQVSIIGIFVRILPKTAIKQQVLAVKECWSSEKILKI